MDGIQWQTIAVFISVLVAWSTLLLKAMDAILGHKIKAFEDRFTSTDKRLENLEREVVEIRRDYVKREDWMSLKTTMEAKFDLVLTRVESLATALGTALASLHRRDHAD
jgi:hypothetical protein